MKRYVINSRTIRENAAKEVSNIKHSEKMEVIIRPHVANKTAEQRDFFHFLCGLISENTGYTKGEVKEWIKRDVLGTSIVLLGNKQVEVTESSEAQLRKKYSELIEGAYRLGAEAGIPLPNPTRGIQ